MAGAKEELEKLKAILSDINENHSLDTKIELLKAELKRYSLTSEIHTLISKKIKEDNENKAKNRINWTVVWQAVIITVIASLVTALITLYFIKGSA